MLIHDDCLNGLKTIGSATVDAAYLDPPFFTQRDYFLQNSTGKLYGFSDHWPSRQDYLTFLEMRLLQVQRVLKDSGSVFLHCDSASSHYIRILLDKIFGENNFRSEIIWTYKRWSNMKRGLQNGHETIFFYSKSANYKFRTIYRDYSPTTNIDQILQERERGNTGKVCYKRDENGNPILAREKRGVPLSDVWDIPFLNPKAKERIGYPTQKPIELLQRILQISTDEGDLVLDPFCGSGTTLVAAKLLHRNYIGIDINADAIQLCQERLSNPVKTESALLKAGLVAYRTKAPDELAILNQFECDIVQRNKGIDAILKKHYLGAPVAVKLQKPSESVQESVSLLYAAGKKKQCSFMVLIVRFPESDDFNIDIPLNMIVVNSNKLEIEQKLKSLVSGSKDELAGNA